MRKLMIGIGLMAVLLGVVTAPSAAAEPADVGTNALVTISATRIPASGFFIPPRIGGDADFNGNGPDVFGSSRLFGVGTRQLRVQIFLDATETVSDFTRARGLSSRILIYEAPVGQCVVSVSRGDYDEITFRDTDHAVDNFTGQVSGSFVSGWSIVGDTTGNEAGTETGAAVTTFAMTANVQPC